MRGLDLMRPVFQSAIWGFSLAVCISGVSAQYRSFSANYNQELNENGPEMTIGEMLADQEIAEKSAQQGRPVPVMMTDYRQNVNSGVSQAAYETNAQNFANPNVFEVQQTAVAEPAAPVQMPSPIPPQGNSAFSSEPRQLPEDFPTGTMAPLNPQSLISFSEVVTLPEGPYQQVTIIDPSQKAICVYHINMGTGQIELKSARKIEWDLQMIFLNSKKPLPQDVQAILQQTYKRR
ncbi:MAG: hypothetical protein IJK97_13575 [Thermoguttaceae bacterium]|nr:hypothetical protein [Thermoguttaceae bacterium]MBR0193428.1 hypothetical protein [Thermoguttaceae bacterium]